jgi:DNA-binding response OmpR family regulator
MDCPCPTCGKPIDFEDIRLESESGILIGRGRFATLTVKELAVFEILWDRPGKIFSKASLCDQVYSLLSDDGPVEKIIDVFVCKIRKKISGCGITIETVWGQGYRLKKDRT